MEPSNSFDGSKTYYNLYNLPYDLLATLHEEFPYIIMDSDPWKRSRT
jgi:hypothetical protein